MYTAMKKEFDAPNRAKKVLEKVSVFALKLIENEAALLILYIHQILLNTSKAKLVFR